MDKTYNIELHSDDIEHLKFLIKEGIDYSGTLQHIIDQILTYNPEKELRQ